jgi:hypothetical protein
MRRRRQIRIGNNEYTFSVNSFILYFHEIEPRPFNLRESYEPRRNFMNRLLSGLFLLLSVTFVAHAQKVEGDWQGVVKDGTVELRVVLHLKKDETGALKGTLDSPDQGVTGIPISSISLKDSVLKFEVPSVGVRRESGARSPRSQRDLVAGRQFLPSGISPERRPSGGKE